VKTFLLGLIFGLVTATAAGAAAPPHTLLALGEENQLTFLNGWWGAYLYAVFQVHKVGLQNMVQRGNVLQYCRVQDPAVVAKVVQDVGNVSFDNADPFNSAVEATMMKCGRAKW
jgi:hypothetical protein